MAYPATDVVTTNLDAGTDSPAAARAQILEAVQGLNSLRSNTGSAIPKHTPYGSNVLAASVQDIFRRFVSAADAIGVDPTGAADSTVGLGYFIANAKAKGFGIDLTGTFKVTQLTLDACHGMHIRGDCLIVGATTGSYSSVVEIKNTTDFAFSGKMVVSASYNTGYGAGIKLWSNTAGGCSLMDLKGVSVVNAAVAWQFGDTSYPDALVSEITVTGGYTYGCPVAAFAIGTQTVATFVGYNLKSDYGSGTGAWLALTQETVIVRGGNVMQIGGELLHAAVSTGCAVKLQPITSPGGFGNTYGSYKGCGVMIETAAPLLQTANPSAVGTPVYGCGSFVQCHGFHSQNVAPMVTTDATFTGDVFFQSNDFYCTVARTVQNMQINGNANVYCDDRSFGRNFKSALAGITGGIVRFAPRLVLAASNLASQSLPNATQTTLKFQSLDNTGDLARFAGNYSTSTGIFTVPTGGLKNVQILFQIVNSGLTSGEIYIQINNVIRGYVNCSKFSQASLNLPALVAGDQIKVVLYNVASGALTGSGGVLDFLQITASN